MSPLAICRVIFEAAVRAESPRYVVSLACLFPGAAAFSTDDRVELKLHRYFLHSTAGGMITSNHWEVRNGYGIYRRGEA
jgi:hypothetical protein